MAEYKDFLIILGIAAKTQWPEIKWDSLRIVETQRRDVDLPVTKITPAIGELVDWLPQEKEEWPEFERERIHLKRLNIGKFSCYVGYAEKNNVLLINEYWASMRK